MSTIGRPCVWTLPSSLKTLHVADLNKDDEAQRRAAFQLITDAAQRADNVGVDEFTEEWFDTVMHYSEVAITLSEPMEQSCDPGCLLGLIILTQSRFSRSDNTDTCQLFTFTAKELGGRHTWRDLARLGTTLVAEAGSYVACVAEVFLPCLEHVLALRDEGFLVIACLPTAGFLTGHPGYVDSYLLYKPLQESSKSTLSLMPSTKEGENDSVENMSFTLCELPDYLPCSCDVDGGQTQIIIRALQRDEVADFYAALKDAAASGRGYGYNEIPALSYFINWYVDDKFSLVLQLATSGNSVDNAVVGYYNFGPSMFSRSRKHPALFEGNIVLRSEYRGRGWMKDLNAVLDGIRVDCGVLCQFEDTAVINVPAVKQLRGYGSSVCGVIPRNVYFSGFGFVDSVLYYRAISPTRSRRRKNDVRSKI